MSESKFTRLSDVHMALIGWVNSKNSLGSARLSEVGIDDFGDLSDEVPVFREWMDDFFHILNRIPDPEDEGYPHQDEIMARVREHENA